MKAPILTSLLIVVFFVAYAAEKPILVTPAWLNEHLNDPEIRVIQVNFLKLDYDAGHIPGAVHLWPQWLAPDSPEGSFNAPDPKEATRVLQSLGINRKTHIVLCHVRGEVSVTARMFLSLENLGLKGRVSYLDGGLEAWKNAGFSVTSEAPVVKKGDFVATPGDLLVDRHYVQKILRSNTGVVVDARMKRYYDGEPTGYPRDGHIAGALNVPYTNLTDASLYTFKPVDSLRSQFAVIPSQEKEVVTYCFIGQTASVVYMAGRMLGYNIRLYDGSLQEWSRIQELPMEKTQK